MARLRQQNPQNYGSSGNIHTDFENIIRYINAAELGNKTIGELFAQLYNEDGVFDGPIEMRVNTATGLEYRVGEYRNPEDGWQLLANIADLRGPAGQNVGQIDGPIFFNRQDTVIDTDGTTNIPYVFDPSVEDIMVWKNGLLLRGTGVSPDYTYDDVNDEVILSVAVDTGALISIVSVRASAISNYRRLDYIAIGTVPTIPFAFSDDERLLVYRNGILQREGASYDYVKSSATGTITFLTPLLNDDVATVMTVENQSQVKVAGLMLEDEFTDGNGFIKYDKLLIEDGEIPQVKIQNLASELSSKAKITINALAPVSPLSGDLWLDTSITPNVLKFYQGTQWLSASTDNALPNFTNANAGQYIRVNGTGTLLEYGDIDFSSLVPKTYIGAANGVAALDSAGKIPTGQLPEIYSVGTIAGFASGALSNTTYRIQTIYKQKIRIDGITAVTSAGSCTIQLAVDGVAVGTTYAVTTTRTNQNITPVIEIDATTAGRLIQVIVTANSSGQNLDVAISYATLSA